ncbi:hypothetical protein SLS62_006692 [Diatrype stigma]|uniref:Uncharacterized protein n=1 Tax=Diatrype stigma TaxID=117547 RepID=A0AAN9UP42_9PEZI
MLLVQQVIIWTPDKFWMLACRNCVVAEQEKTLGVSRLWVLGYKYLEGAETRLHLAGFQGKNPWDLGIEENLRQVLGRQVWQWFLFWVQPERVSRYGKYVDRDLPYAEFVIRHRTDFLMPPLTSVAVDDGSGTAASPTPVEAAYTSRRRQQRSSSAQHQPASSSTSHVQELVSPAVQPIITALPTPAGPAVKPARRRYELSWSTDSA